MKKIISIVLSLMFSLQSSVCSSFASEKANDEKSYSNTETNPFIRDAFKEIQPFFENDYFNKILIGNKLAQLEAEKNIYLIY